jgi:hypothetical protein
MSTLRKTVLALRITAAAFLALLLLAAGCAGSKGGGNNPPINTRSPIVAANLVTADWGAMTGFNVSGGPGAAQPGALVVLIDPANTTASITANPDGSFEIIPDPLLFDNTPGTVLELTQYAGGLDESEPIEIIVPPM